MGQVFNENIETNNTRTGVHDSIKKATSRGVPTLLDTRSNTYLATMVGTPNVGQYVDSVRLVCEIPERLDTRLTNWDYIFGTVKEVLATQRSRVYHLYVVWVELSWGGP